MGIKTARQFALDRHGNQPYTDMPYAYHLDGVAEVLTDFGFDDYVHQASAFLHDVVEDTNTPIEEIGVLFGLEVQDMVWSCSGFGKNRITRNMDIAQKLALYPKGCILKVADRIFNHRTSICEPLSGEPSIKHARMYFNERDQFLYSVKQHIPVVMLMELLRTYEVLGDICAVRNSE